MANDGCSPVDTDRMVSWGQRPVITCSVRLYQLAGFSGISFRSRPSASFSALFISRAEDKMEENIEKQISQKESQAMAKLNRIEKKIERLEEQIERLLKR